MKRYSLLCKLNRSEFADSAKASHRFVSPKHFALVGGVGNNRSVADYSSGSKSKTLDRN